MVTSLHRFSITETPEIAHAIDIAVLSWPEFANNRAAVLRQIIKVGSEAIERQTDERIARRRAALEQVSGSMTGTWPPNAIDKLRNEWNRSEPPVDLGEELGR